jgi:hypothetical protein
MTKVVGMKCCKCGTTATRWWYRDYDNKKEWTGLRICYDCKLNKEKEENRKLKEKRIGVRKCIKCGNVETYVTSRGYECWARYHDDEGKWDKKSYLCNSCEQKRKQEETTNEIKRIQDERLKERKCIECESVETLHWFKQYDEKGNKTNKFICNKCYMKSYNGDPDSYSNIIKSMRNCRSNKEIDLSNFSNFSDQDKGRIGEDIVSYTLGVDNQNDASNNYSSLYDLVHHHIYGKIEVKTASFDDVHNCWDVTLHIGRNFDTLIILCMGKEKPWRHVEMAYVIPEDCNELYGIRYVGIYDNPKSKWEKFRVNVKPYNDTYHKMDMYIKFFGNK